MSLPARLRLVLARSPWLYWAIVAALAGVAGLLVMRAADSVDAARDRGARRGGCSSPPATSRPATRSPGRHTVRAASRHRWSPPTPSTDLAAGAVARQHDRRRRGDRRPRRVADGDAAVVDPRRLARRRRRRAVPSGARVGDRVTVATGGVVVAADGLVVGVVGEALLVAVPADVPPQVANAASTGDVAVLLRR